MITDPGNPSPWDAAAYDEWFDAPWGRYAFRIERATLERATGPLDRRRVLDVRCGTGRFTSDLAERAKSLVGLDFDPAVLSVAARHVQAPLLIADTHRLPFPAGLFDVSVAMTLCEFVDDAQHVVAELVRVTRPGGRVVVGALNRRSAWGAAHRRRLREPPWSTAHLFSRRSCTLSVALTAVCLSFPASPGLADTEHEAARAVSWKDVHMPRPHPPEFRQRAVELARLAGEAHCQDRRRPRHLRVLPAQLDEAGRHRRRPARRAQHRRTGRAGRPAPGAAHDEDGGRDPQAGGGVLRQGDHVLPK